jgi:hypothetical protein
MIESVPIDKPVLDWLTKPRNDCANRLSPRRIEVVVKRCTRQIALILWVSIILPLSLRHVAR